ncbi:GNAT family protein [Clostridium sp. AL.422]|uniref:GNAT family N-acetyltransferase n=1 Tax=Clostridium TaxID=1485 RepID=UPI00293DBE53|nr:MULTISPECIES: GNAT family protein [unclassified Clostridium]MDV4150142.1 GNAT family protein [Clostridium sp. AL.422]
MEKYKMSWQKDGIVLRSFQHGQADKYYKDCFQVPDEEVDRLTGSSGNLNYEGVVNYYNRIVDDTDRYDFMIIDSEGRFIGESVINEIDWELKSANFRIVIFRKEGRSKGIGSWVVKATRDFAFEYLNLHRLELEVFAFNPRAKRAYEKAGFKVEGVKKEAILNGDKYDDVIIMAILKDEWKAIKELE